MADFIYTSAIKKLRKLKKRIRVIPGGTSAGKTFGILPVLIDRACRTPLLEISVVSESVPHLRKGALKDFLKIMKSTNRYIDANYNRTLLVYTFSNGSYIEFFSADQEDKVRGPRRHILYMNEANNLEFETYHQLAIRTSKEIWLDFNPSNSFWAHEELTNDEDAEWLTLTYKDNEALEASIIKEIEKAKAKAYHKPGGDIYNAKNIKSKYWDNWWKVYGLGLIGSLQGVIFDNWEQVETIPEGAKLLGYGQDFGFTNDPTTLMALYQSDGIYYWDEIFYLKGLSNSDISAQFKENAIGKEMIMADCADPKTISELRAYGHNVVPCQKGTDSINFGISIIQQAKFFITKRSVNTIKELRKYSWDSDKAGTKINKPIDAFNHSIDAMRYAAMQFISNRPKMFFG